MDAQVHEHRIDIWEDWRLGLQQAGICELPTGADDLEPPEVDWETVRQLKLKACLRKAQPEKQSLDP